VCYPGGAYVIGKYGHSCFYFGPAMLCIPFYAVGFQFKDRFKREDFNLKYCAVSFFVWLLGFVLICRSPQNVAMNLVSQNYFTFYVIAISGSVFVMEISKLVNCEFIGWFGRNTIVPMMVHVTFRIVIGKIMLAETMIFYFAFAVAVIIVSSVFIPLFRNKKYDLFK
jgi:Zn-dependent protease with chaperone function